MSIYVLRSAELVKIGYSANLYKRVGSIVSGSPVAVEFVGHMPGERDVEAHLHQRFAAHRFSGEWFVETDEMRSVFVAILTPKMPQPLPPKGPIGRRERDHSAVLVFKDRLREAGARLFPMENHAGRTIALANALGWPKSRVKDVYYGDMRVSLRAIETEELNAFLLAPELKAEIGEGE